MKQKYPKVSIIILNWNGKKWLEKCLPTVKKIKYKQLEVIVVNNGSTDDSGDFMEKKYPWVRIIELKKNRGFAGANNIGVKKATGKYILLLNNDTEVTPDFIQPLVERMEEDPLIGVIQPQLRSMRNHKLLDSAVSFFTLTGFLYHYGYMQEAKKPMYNKELSCYSIKGACMMMKKVDYINLGGLDEDFVCYVEETDLCHRMLLSGKRVVYYPFAHIYHYGGGDMSIMEKGEVTIYRATRNRFISLIKNLSTLELIKVLPLQLFLTEGLVVMTLLKGRFKNAAAVQLGVVSWLFNLEQILKKRKQIQSKIRKLQDKEFLPFVTNNPSFSYYIHFFTNPGGKYKEKPLG